jgi:hypothetical protein
MVLTPPTPAQTYNKTIRGKEWLCTNTLNYRVSSYETSAIRANAEWAKSRTERWAFARIGEAIPTDLPFRLEHTEYGEPCVSLASSGSALWSDGNRGARFDSAIQDDVENWQAKLLAFLLREKYWMTHFSLDDRLAGRSPDSMVPMNEKPIYGYTVESLLSGIATDWPELAEFIHQFVDASTSPLCEIEQVANRAKAAIMAALQLSEKGKKFYLVLRDESWSDGSERSNGVFDGQGYRFHFRLSGDHLLSPDRTEPNGFSWAETVNTGGPFMSPTTIIVNASLDGLHQIIHAPELTEAAKGRLERACL